MAGHEHDREALVQIGTADNGMIASLWRQVLDEEGIRSMAKPAGAGAGYFSPDMQPQLIYVLASDAKRAQAILAEMEEEPDVPLDGETQVETEPDAEDR